MSLCALMGITLTGFFVYHLYLAFKNVTSNERMKRLDMSDDPKYEHLAIKPNIYDKGFFKNAEEILEAQGL